VPLPTPAPGLVIRYSYLWHGEFLAGRDEGVKDRPCAIVAAVRESANGETRVLVLPITHSAPAVGVAAIEIPVTIKPAIGLDAAPAWIVLAEWNEFVWPGPDLRPLRNDDEGSVVYGYLSRGFFARVRDDFLAAARASRSKRVPRTE
jgi:hypothetical protein